MVLSTPVGGGGRFEYSCIFTRVSTAIFPSRFYAKGQSILHNPSKEEHVYALQARHGITNLVATSEAVLPQDIQTDDTYPQQSMRVRKRTGSAEPVDVTKIVCAVQ